MPVKALIFDMDGVIVDSEPVWNQSRVEMAAAHGKQWNEADQRAVMGSSTLAWAKVMRERLDLPMSDEAVIDEVRRRMIAHYDQRLPVLPGAVEAVRLAASAYPVALGSGSMSALITYVMHATGLDQILKVVVRGDDIPRGKPEPDIYLEAARQLGVAPADCAGVEDSGHGVMALRAAGMKVIVVSSPWPLPESVLALTDLRLQSLADFSLELVKTLG